MGGICTLAQFAYNICQQLDEKTFREHFEFEKYVTIDGEKIINPTLLADVVTGIDTDFFSKTLSLDGKLVPNGKRGICLGLNGIDSINVKIANKYLATKTNQAGVGLNIEVQANQRSDSYRNEELILPESDVELREMYISEISKSLEDGCSIALEINNGNLINASDPSVIAHIDPASGVGHSATIVGIDMEKASFEVSTYGDLWYLPFDQLHKFYQTRELYDGIHIWPAVSHGFTAFHIVETNQ